MLAVILESADPERLYTGLSLLVSAEEARGLATFGALGALLGLDADVRGAHVIASEQEPFARTLVGAARRGRPAGSGPARPRSRPPAPIRRAWRA